MTEGLANVAVTEQIHSKPIGPLGLVPLESCREMGKKVDFYLTQWRSTRESQHKEEEGYERDTYIIASKISRFGTGEAKGTILESVRGDDLYLMVDVCNYAQTYKIFGEENHTSPDDHFADVKRIIAAIAGKAKRLTVIMPFLYEGRRSTRSGRESLDCAIALQELVNMGVSNIITFDAHDSRVQNAIPLSGFETVQPIYQFLKALLRAEKDLKIDPDHMMVVSPDEGGMSRAIYFANMMGLDAAMFYKRRNYTEPGNPVVATEYLGADVAGKDIMLVDDMISSGDSIVDVAKSLKSRGARKVFICVTFGLFTGGLEEFDRLYEEGIIDRLLTTNLVYQMPELLERKYYTSVDLSKYIALLIDRLNHDASISELLVPTDRVNRIIEKYRKGEEI